MTEEKKKRGIVKRILRWIWLGILTLLILGALIYDASWKVLALLLILLAAHTILPKGAVKWFWLSVAAVVVILIIWVFLPEQDGNWRPFTFEEDLAVLKAKYALPDSENAAIAYDKLFEHLDIDSNQPEFYSRAKFASTDEPWRSADHPETADWLKGQQGTIESLLQISKMGRCQFLLRATAWDFSSDRYSKMRHCAFLLVSAANNDVAEGRIDAALEKWLCLIQMAKHIRQQPTMIDTLVGIAIEAIASKQFNRFIVTGDATEERLSVIEKAVTEIKHDWSTDFPRFIEGEKLFAKNFLGMFYEVNPNGKTRLTRDTIRPIMAQLPQDMKDKMAITYWHKRIMKAWTILGWFFMPSTPQKAGRIFDECYEKYNAMTEPNFAWREKSPDSFSMLEFYCQIKLNYRYFANFMADMATDSLYRVRDLYLRVTADNRGSRTIIALRRYKNKYDHWPENLDEVKSLAPAEIFVDPINESSFVYKLTDDSFTLYSKGKNNIDEDGKRDRGDEEKTGADDWLIWPPRSKKPETHR